MSLKQFCFVALPLWVALFFLLFRAKQRNLKTEMIVAKCAGSFLPFAGAVLAVYAQPLRFDGGNPLTSPWCWFFFLCMVADALLEIWFIPGMLTFAAAHAVLGVSLTLRLLQAQPGLPWWSLLVWVGIVVLALILFRRDLGRQGKLAVLFAAYPMVLGWLLTLALVMPVATGSWSEWPLALGLICFFVSDLMVAKRFFHPNEYRWMEQPIMMLYWGALCLLCSTLMIR